jgi:predicted ATPase
MRRSPDSVLIDIDSLARLVSEHDVRSFSGYLKFAQGWLNWVRGDASVGLAEMSEGISYSRGLGIHICLPQFEAELAQAEAEAGQIDTAIARLKQAHEEIELTGERWCEAALHRIRGNILLNRDSANTAPAEEAFLTAVAIAQQQKARSFELRAATSMARLWRDQGKQKEARELLAPVYDWFTEGFDTRDLKEAKALLDELAA